MRLITTKMHPSQRSMIFGLCKDKGVNDETRRELMQSWIGKSSLTADISGSEAHTIIENLKKLPNIQPKLSDKQRRAIKAIQADLLKKSEKYDNKWLENFMNHTVGQKNLSSLTPDEATKFINGLKAIEKGFTTTKTA